MFFKNKKFLTIIVVAVAAIGVAAFLYFQKPWDGFKNLPLASYSHPAFGVTFKYPATWATNQEGGAFDGIPLRYDGADGYVGVDALAIDEDFTFDALLDKLVIKNSLVPYGTRPIIKSTEIDGLEARVILPSDDQPADANNEAVFVARYPGDRKIGDNLFGAFILYAHKDFLEDILRTLHFDLSGGTPEEFTEITEEAASN